MTQFYVNTQTMRQERDGQVQCISWAAAVCVTGLAVIPRYPAWRANHRMPSSQQETTDAQGHHTGVQLLPFCIEQVWPWTPPTSPLMSSCVCGHILYVAVRSPYMHTYVTYRQPAVAQHTQADSTRHLCGTAPKEKQNSFNRGRAGNGRLISACVFISWPSIPQSIWLRTHQWC